MTQEKQQPIEWDPEVREKYERMIVKIPLFHRQIADKVARRRAEINAQERGSTKVEERDVVLAFFEEVPKAFYSLMVKLMGDVGFNYRAYEEKQDKKNKR